MTNRCLVRFGGSEVPLWPRGVFSTVAAMIAPYSVKAIGS